MLQSSTLSMTHPHPRWQSHPHPVKLNPGPATEVYPLNTTCLISSIYNYLSKIIAESHFTALR